MADRRQQLIQELKDGGHHRLDCDRCGTEVAVENGTPFAQGTYGVVLFLCGECYEIKEDPQPSISLDQMQVDTCIKALKEYQRLIAADEVPHIDRTTESEKVSKLVEVLDSWMWREVVGEDPMTLNDYPTDVNDDPDRF